MEKTVAFLAALLLLVSCSHKRDGELIKTADGKIYKLKACAVKEGYTLEEIDTAAYNKFIKPIKQ